MEDFILLPNLFSMLSRRSPCYSRPGSSKTSYYDNHDNRERYNGGRIFYENEPRPSHSHRREYDRETGGARDLSPSQYRRRY